MANGIKIPIISNIPVLGDLTNWLANIVAAPVNLGVNTVKTVLHAGGEALSNVPLFAKWGGLIGAAVGAFTASSEGKDMIAGAFDGGIKGLTAGAVGGATVGGLKGAFEGAIPTIQQAGSDVGAVASALFPQAQELPNVAKPPSDKGISA